MTDMSEFEAYIKSLSPKKLVSEHKEIGRAIDSYTSESAIRIAQNKRKKIRDCLVYRHGWDRAKANKLAGNSVHEKQGDVENVHN